MTSFTYQSALAFLQTHGYVVLFAAILIEGPVFSAAAGFIAAQGYFSLWVVLVLSFLGNELPDLFFFLLGRWSRASFIKKYGKFMGLTPSRMRAIESQTTQYGDNVVLIGKLTPLTGPTTLFFLGAAQYNSTRFLIMVSVINIISAVVFTLLGFYLGIAYTGVARYVNFATAAIIVICLLFIFVPKALDRIKKNVEARSKKQKKSTR